MRLKVIIPVLIFLMTIGMKSQSDKNLAIAFEWGVKGIEFLNKGKFDSAITAFDQAILIDAKSISYPYEKSLAYYQKKDYKTASAILDSLLSHPEANDQIYQLLGNSYDNLGMDKKSAETYKKGLEKFPNSGRIHMELGLLEQKKNTTIKSLSGKSPALILGYWEKGVDVDPAFAYNYYYLSQFYCTTVEKIWGLIYGEVFMNIADNPKRIAEVSKCIYQTTQSGLFSKGDSVLNPRFTSVKKFTDVEDFSKMRFEEACQKILTQSAEGVMPHENILSLDNYFKLREEFIKLWFAKGLNKIFPNSLFEWHKKLIDCKLFEAYNHNVFSSIDNDMFKNWYSKNKKKQDKLAEWLKENAFVVNEKNKIYKYQYDK